jgi:hypothetical protein
MDNNLNKNDMARDAKQSVSIKPSLFDMSFTIHCLYLTT